MLRSTQKFLEQVLKLRSWTLPFLFRVLFPQDSLIDQNHSAVIDAIQLAQILQLSAKLIKAPKERILPEGLLQGFKELAWLDDEYTQSNTLDHYFESVGRNTSDGADGEVYVQKDDEEDFNNEDIGDEDIDDEDTDDEKFMMMMTLTRLLTRGSKKRTLLLIKICLSIPLTQAQILDTVSRRKLFF